MAKRRTWKFWTGITLLLILLLGIGWVVNLVWFRPFNIRHFYDKVFIELALGNPELVTQMGIPVLYDLTKDELTDVSDVKQWQEFNQIKENYATLLSYDVGW